MSQPFRLREGGRIDRSRRLDFRFNGRRLEGHAGDTLASALLANGVHFVARSFKYHRPRGIYTAGEEEPSALVEVGTGDRRTPSCRATQVPLTAGLTARSQLGWPYPGFDLGRVFDFTHRLWPAGFYNKTFKWPGWNVWEPMIRRLAGLGHAPRERDPDAYEQVNLHCDLLVCGAGPAGLAAAQVAARAGLRVVLAEQDGDFGGTLNQDAIELGGMPSGQWVAQVTQELGATPGVVLLPATTVCGVYDHLVTTLLQRGENTSWRECLWIVRPRRILLATGAIEQGLVFPGNDRPGIMLASAVRQYLNRYAVACGRRVVIATNNDSAYQTALDCHRAGIEVAAIVDSRSEVREELRGALQDAGVPVHPGSRIGATRGGRRVRAVRIEGADGSSRGGVATDLLAVSGGWAPRVHLLCHARGRLHYDPAQRCFVAARVPYGFVLAGSVSGMAGLQTALVSGVRAARQACRELGFAPPSTELPIATRSALEPGVTGEAVFAASRQRQWIDLAHDVTLHDAELAVREGFDAVEHFKRFTTSGMAVDQGKTGNLNAFSALAAITGRAIEAIGTTTYRPPYVPMTLGALASAGYGERFAPRRYLPAHVVHRHLGAHFQDYGGWQRPECYPRERESPRASIERECLAVRNGVGVFDNSPIGKIEVRGPDAAEFLHRVYLNDVHGLETGCIRYGPILNENGVIIDDGVFARLAPDHFLVNTTSGGLGRILGLFEELQQCDWPDLQVVTDDVTSKWANFTVAGPLARDLLAPLIRGLDLAPQALPHMRLGTGFLGDLPVRVLRVSFSGEASYEINLPADAAAQALGLLLDKGEPLGVTPYGIEALMLLRLEKGYLHFGTDTDGMTTPDDVGWGEIARRKPADFLGKRSLARPGNLDPGRRQLVGIVPLAADGPLTPGAHLLLGDSRRLPQPTDGWITSAAWSPTLRRHIGLALVRAGRSHLGEVVTAFDLGRRQAARLVAPTFFDPQNERLRT